MNVLKATNQTMVPINAFVMVVGAGFFVALAYLWFQGTFTSDHLIKAIAALVIWQVFNVVGIAAGAHRYFSHRAFECNRFWQYVMAYFCMVSLVGPPCIWAEAHRVHHQHADTDKDPYRKWMINGDQPLSHTTTAKPAFLAKVVRQDRLHYLTLKYYWLYVLSYIAVAALVGYVVDMGAFAGFVVFWAIPAGLSQLTLRIVLWTGHLPNIGYRSYPTPDTSNNSWWVSLISSGEGWHNNHHRHPGAPKAGERWWEVDITWWFIKAIRSKA